MAKFCPREARLKTPSLPSVILSYIFQPFVCPGRAKQIAQAKLGSGGGAMQLPSGYRFLKAIMRSGSTRRTPSTWFPSVILRSRKIGWLNKARLVRVDWCYFVQVPNILIEKKISICSILTSTFFMTFYLEFFLLLSQSWRFDTNESESAFLKLNNIKTNL